ncbi:MAG TPA: hypothetical protein PKN48_01040 [Bacteroidales bacterium]|nr:hypothetical protein [Bacteroidales bacterium]
MKFKVNDKVMVIKKIESLSDGWEGEWVSGMDKHIGKEYVIRMCGGVYGYLLSTLSNGTIIYWFPETALELSVAMPIYNKFEVIAL